MKREALIRALRKYARKRDLPFELEKARGKGAHYRVRVGARFTTLQSGELSPFHTNRICQQLEIDPAEL